MAKPGDNTAPAVKPRRAPRPKGRPLVWSDADLLVQATPTALDVADAAVMWRQYAPSWARALFDTTRNA